MPKCYKIPSYNDFSRWPVVVSSFTTATATHFIALIF